jgi:hypothetical protein
MHCSHTIQVHFTMHLHIQLRATNIATSMSTKQGIIICPIINANATCISNTPTWEMLLANDQMFKYMKREHYMLIYSFTFEFMP